MELVAWMAAEYYQQSSVPEKRLPILQVSETIAPLVSVNCRQFRSEYLQLSQHTAPNNTHTHENESDIVPEEMTESRVNSAAGSTIQTPI